MSTDQITRIDTTFVPGTELLYDNNPTDDATAAYLHGLQHVKHGDSHILLVPQPSIHDPNDPLRWSLTKKWLTLLNGILYSFNGAITGPIMAAGKYLCGSASGAY